MNASLMKMLRDLPIRRKLMLITTIISGAALIVACAAFTAYDYIAYRHFMVTEWTASADLVGANCTAAISFGDHEAATEALGSLRNNPGVLKARIYDQQKRCICDLHTSGSCRCGSASGCA